MALNDMQLTYAAFDLWLGSNGEDNRAELERVKRMLPMILEACCTDVQLKYIMHYFADGMTMEQIADRYFVTISTVSRTIRRGIDNAYPYLKFCSPLFIKQPKKRGYLVKPKKRGLLK